VLLSQGFEYLATDLDPANVRAARQAGEPVIWGDSADEDLLRSLGVDHATVVIVTFAAPSSPSAWCGPSSPAARMSPCSCAPG